MIDLSDVASLRWVMRDVWKSMQRNREIDRLVADGGLKPLAALDVSRFKRSDTLVILGHKARRKGIDFVREYAADLPEVEVYGSELHPHWNEAMVNSGAPPDFTMAFHTACKICSSASNRCASSQP